MPFGALNNTNTSFMAARLAMNEGRNESRLCPIAHSDTQGASAAGMTLLYRPLTTNSTFFVFDKTL